jgi:hypothetical protein
MVAGTRVRMGTGEKEGRGSIYGESPPPSQGERDLFSGLEALSHALNNLTEISDTLRIIQSTLSREQQALWEKMEASIRALSIEKQAIIRSLRGMELGEEIITPPRPTPIAQGKRSQYLKQLRTWRGTQTLEQWSGRDAETWFEVDLLPYGEIERQLIPIVKVVEDKYADSYSGPIDRSWRLTLGEGKLIDVSNPKAASESHGALNGWLRGVDYFGYPPITLPNGRVSKILVVKTPTSTSTRGAEAFFQLVLYKEGRV